MVPVGPQIKWPPVIAGQAVQPDHVHGNYEGGFAMAAVGAGYHEAFGATIVAGRGLRTADAGAPNGPVVGTCSAACSLVPVVSSAAASSPATA